MKKWMIYGANGYTGELIAREAVSRGMSPVLGGRNAGKIRPLAEELSLEFQAFPLDGHAAAQLKNIDLVLHCAGPFQVTSEAMIQACLSAKTHYLDITGEVSVFEHTHSLHAQAAEREVVLCSGVGFDVVPTDCIALKLKEEMPDATELWLGFDSDSGISPGTFKTMIQGLGSGNMLRRGGVLKTVPIGSQHRTIDFGRGSRSAMGIPWGDVSTAFYTTGIPNISAWIPMPKPQIYSARLLGAAGPLLSTNWVKEKLEKQVEKRVQGPDSQLRANSPAYIWGEAKNQKGVIKVARIRTANVYDLTVYGSLEIVRRLLNEKVEGGFYTPAGLFGSGLVETLPGSGTFEIDTFYPR
ncbi:saccharopine dehydrogenase NADP-binding domain-containing protein [Planococcus sp. ISL-110]|uniref:saccharopine dehydrogenase family protein n=1 Tax=Planococcus sp. ISL-110 TaxID=2819167 RepID=UPI001BECE530|nr:saccharopine dehydrogenase NADP-binding domain-containing protein [Planococcus sp. ISL-110]MBT2571406.1 saccharopine dehydrogenase NADP-binding domain-containing protein [Planococcus sp. ISL-110]